MADLNVTQDTLSAQVEAALDAVDGEAARLGRQLTKDETRKAIGRGLGAWQAARLVLRQPEPVSIETSPRPVA